MSEKPRKRLVGWNQYLAILGKKGIIYGIGFLCIIAVCVCFLGVGSAGVWILLRGADNFVVTLIVCGVSVGILMLRSGKFLYTKAKSMEAVALITRHNTGHLPAVETLVRASGLPPSHQQAELLRAAQYGNETPPEELLRATTTTGKGEV